MRKVLFVCVAVALLLGVAANAKADWAKTYDNQDKYMSTVAKSDWGFANFHKEGDDNKDPLSWTFKVTPDGTGTLIMSIFNGNGGLMQEPTVGSDGSSLSFWHNSANEWTMTFVNAMVDSYYLALDPHSSFSAAINFELTAKYMVDGKEYFTDATLNENNQFFGITLEEGAYLTEIYFKSTGTDNNGYKVNMGFGGNYDPEGGGSRVTNPEPATLLILGLGAVGAGLAARRRKSL